MRHLIYEDFRASVRPQTAERRLRYFSNQLDYLESRTVIADLYGDVRPEYRSVESALERLFRAQIEFANLQISAKPSVIGAGKERP